MGIARALSSFLPIYMCLNSLRQSPFHSESSYSHFLSYFFLTRGPMIRRHRHSGTRPWVRGFPLSFVRMCNLRLYFVREVQSPALCLRNTTFRETSTLLLSSPPWRRWQGGKMGTQLLMPPRLGVGTPGGWESNCSNWRGWRLTAM